ncbi:unnamed protein product [Withania somnifera]
MKHNNVIPNGHFKKHWRNYVRTWFNQPARKTRRRNARPTAGSLRPIVHGQTLKYNMKATGIPKKLAPTIGIAVDHRRRNRSLEGLQTNVQRLKTYKAKLVIFPRLQELARHPGSCGPYPPITREQPTVELVKVSDEMKSFNAYGKLRIERTNARHMGARLKRALKREKEEKK